MCVALWWVGQVKEEAFQATIKGHLDRFQINEEGRARFIKEQLQRLQGARASMLTRLERGIRSICDAAAQVDPAADLVVYCQQVRGEV